MEMEGNDMSETPITDAEYKRQNEQHELMRECGEHPFSADFDFARRLEKRLAAMTAERDALVQTCGELCPHCGWRGLRGDAGECAFCQNAKLSADLYNMTAAKELAERQVVVLCRQIGETGWCPTEQTCYPTAKCADCWAAWSRAEAEGGKG